MMLMFSSWFTAMKRSALRTEAFRSVAKVVQSPSIVTMSDIPSTSSSSLASASMTVMSWWPPLSIFARWLPTSPAPAMIIFIEIL